MLPTGEAAASEQSTCSERSSGNLNLQGSLLKAQQDVIRSQIQVDPGIRQSEILVLHYVIISSRPKTTQKKTFRPFKMAF